MAKTRSSTPPTSAADGSTTAATAGWEIVSTRIIDAPRQAVFAAFEKVEDLVRWWGPNGFTNTNKEFDLRPGGTWRIVMHGPNGADYHNESQFREVVKPERVVYRHLGPMHEFQMIMTFADAAPRRTRLTWRIVLEPSAKNKQLKQAMAEANEQNFDRLAAFLARRQD